MKPTHKPYALTESGWLHIDDLRLRLSALTYWRQAGRFFTFHIGPHSYGCQFDCVNEADALDADLTAYFSKCA